MTTTPRRYILSYPARPWTTNAERRLAPHARARLVKEWREAFFWLAKSAEIPRLEAATVTVVQHSRDARWKPDTGACMPAAKAAVDGLVDAGVLADDGAAFVRALVFLPPVIDGADGLELVIKEVVEEEEEEAA